MLSRRMVRMSCLKTVGFSMDLFFSVEMAPTAKAENYCTLWPKYYFTSQNARKEIIEFSCVKVLLSQQPLPAVHHMGWSLVKFPTHTGISTRVVIVQVFFRWACRWAFMGNIFLSGLESTTEQQASYFPGSYNHSFPSSARFPES